jgi:hypothetical protein
MSSDQLSSEEVLSRCAALLAAIEALRKPAEQKASPWWSGLLNSTVLATLITVVVGGLFGKIIVASFQQRQQNNAIAQAQYRSFIGKQQEVVQSSIGIIGDAQYDVAGLLALTQPSFNVRDSHGRMSPALDHAREALITAHNDNIKKWNTEKYRTQVLLTYYFLGNVPVTTSWRDLVDAMDSLENCAQSAYLAGPSSQSSEQICKAQQDVLQKTLGELSGALDKARAYSWQQISLGAIRP